MNILFLTNNEISNQLILWLRNKAQEKVTVIKTNISKEMVKSYNPDFLISYNYKYIIKEDVLSLLKNRAINLHISFLPWNRGAYPNVWSFLEDTHKGVTIHYIDEGVDTGAILFQKEVFIDEAKNTLKTSYEKLHKEIQELFKNNWGKIKTGKVCSSRQVGGGACHYKSEYKLFEPYIRQKGWDTTIRRLKAEYKP